MSQNKFVARNWLSEATTRTPRHFYAGENDQNPPPLPADAKSPKYKFPRFIPKEVPRQQSSKFSPTEFLIPEWQGDSLSSKEAIELKNIGSILLEDAHLQLSHQDHFPKKLIKKIYDEFLHFSALMGLNLPQLDTPEAFWEHLHNPQTPYLSSLQLFLKVYGGKVVTLYFFKLRFIKFLTGQLHYPVQERDLHTPHAIFYKLFPKGSSKELRIEAFESNQYSWYQPSPAMQPALVRAFHHCSLVELPETLKALSPLLSTQDNEHFSHALSHKNFGLFLNQLNVSFPQWIAPHREGKMTATHRSKDGKMEIHNTLFTGDYIDELSISHWMAQDNNNYFKWDQIICPEFIKDSKLSHSFTKMLNGLQFATFLVQIYTYHEESVIDFLADTIKRSREYKKEFGGEQKSFFLDEIESHTTYHRAILSYIRPQKNNAHFYLLSKINETIEKIQDYGYLIVLSSQNLFVHSQKEKVEQLLTKVKLESIFNFENLKGKGESPQFIYLFCKLPKDSQVESQTCLNFRFTANLETFYQFSEVTSELDAFFNKFLVTLPAIFQNAEDHAIKLEFFHDAIVNGQLIHSSSKDSTQITHPQFFNNLMKNCLPFDYFFDIQGVDQSFQGIDFEAKRPNQVSRDLLGFREYPELDGLFIAIDFRNSDELKLEVIPREYFKAKSYEYGFAKCYYYQITPKLKSININLFKDYFQSKIGKQIISLSFTGSYNQMKSKLARLLIPNVFQKSPALTEEIAMGTQFLTQTEDDLSLCDKDKLIDTLKRSQNFILNWAQDYPVEILSRISYFKTQLYNYKAKLNWEENHVNHLNFNSREIKSALVLEQTYPIYPHNEDIFIDMKVSHGEELYRPLSEIKTHNHVNSTQLDLCFENKVVVSIHCEQIMASLIQFILSKAVGMPIFSLIQKLSIPSTKNLTELIRKYTKTSQTIDQSAQITTDIYERILFQLINRSK